MITYDNGRFRSHRPVEEAQQLIDAEIENLTDEEKLALNLLIKELATKQKQDVVNAAERLEWDPDTGPPIPIRQWVNDEYYLGETARTLWPQLKDDMVEFFEGDYAECILTGSTRWGKDYFSTTALVRIIYELYCLKRPTDTLGLGRGETIHIVPISHTKEAAQRVVFKGIVTKLALSPFWKGRYEYTKEEIRFPGKDIVIIAGGSNEGAALGLNVWAALMDEGNFFAKQRKGHVTAGGGKEDKSEGIYDSLRRRISGTYAAKGLRGRLIMISSKKSIHDFTERRLREAMKDEDNSVFVRDYCLVGETKIPLLDGTEPTIQELAERYEGSDETFWVYSSSKGLVLPGRAHHPRLTKKNAPVVKVTLDDGGTLRLTADHRVMLRDGSYREAGKLVHGDSLMPLYRRINKRGYEELGQPTNGGKWETTHRMSARSRHGGWRPRGSDGKPVVIHHEDCNKRNNTPENLRPMEWDKHQQLHAELMQPLLDYVRSDKHRKWASSHMTALHKDPAFAERRNERARRALKKLRLDPTYVEKQRKAASKTLVEFHKTPLGRQRQAERNIKRWDKVGRKISVEEIQTAASLGKNVRKLAESHDCTTGAIRQVLKRAGLPTYAQLRVRAGYEPYDRRVKKVQKPKQSDNVAPGNHSVVSVEDDGVSDVYDLSVEEYENFAVGAGIFVHNCTWDVRPDAFIGQKWHRAAVSQKIGRVRILEDDEGPEDHEIWFKFPDEYIKEFRNDPAGASRDIAGIALESFRPFFSNREAIADMQKPGRPHPFHVYEWNTSREINPIWANMVMNNVHGDPVPRCCPNAHRHCHMDLSKNKDATGICCGHVAGETEVSRLDPITRERVKSEAPLIHIDLCLRIVPPHAGEIEHELVRGLIYALRSGGLPIRSVSADRWMGLPNLQLISKHGFKTEEISTQRNLDPYLAAQGAMYERRIESPVYTFLSKELRELELNAQGTKVDHPRTGCFAGDTKVRLLDGRRFSFKQLVELCNNESFLVPTIRDGEVSAAEGYAPRITARDAEVLLVSLGNGDAVRCTPDHRFMLLNGTYQEAQYLSPGTQLRGLSEQGVERSVFVSSVVAGGRADVYDISVEETSNFLLDAGVFVHNSKDLADAFAAVVYYLTKNWQSIGIGGVSMGVLETPTGVPGEAYMTADGNFRWPDEPPLPQEGGEDWSGFPTYII